MEDADLLLEMDEDEETEDTGLSITFGFWRSYGFLTFSSSFAKYVVRPV